ncbi:MAG: hypothetical protein ACI8QG_002538 [Flavobacteriales bacterium]|jgi:hypothetical protein
MQGKLTQGIIVVARDSKISSLYMLNNVEIEFPALAVFTTTVLPQANLTLRNITFSPNTLYYYKRLL